MPHDTYMPESTRKHSTTTDMPSCHTTSHAELTALLDKLGSERSEHDVILLPRLLRAAPLEKSERRHRAVDDVRVGLGLPELLAGEFLADLRLDAEAVIGADQRRQHAHDVCLGAARPALHSANEPAAPVLQEAIHAPVGRKRLCGQV